VTIGEALTQARHRAGLSVAQVSQKTRIREAIIRDIERDDYSSCGGDFYARGHIRAMARAAGADSEVFIRQYDAARSGTARLADGTLAAAGRPAAAEEFGPDGFAAPEEFGTPDDFRPEEYAPAGSGAPDEFGPEEPGGFAVPEGAAPGGFAPDYLETGTFAALQEGALAALQGGGSGEFGGSGQFASSQESPLGEELTAPEEITAPHRVVAASQMAAFDDIMSSRPAAAPGGTAPQRRQARPAVAGRPGGPDRIVVTAVALALAIFGGLAYLLVAGTGGAPQAGAAAATGRAAQREPTSGRRHQGATNSPATPRSSAPATTSPVTLTPARAVAFGPGGPAHGDNPQNAALAIDHRPRTAWHTDWYTTSHFGSLKAGTGLLLDMGHRVTISSARIRLGAMPGADLQLRAGGSATLAGLRPVASAADARGTIRLRPASPAHARYVLIWFTQLPPDPAGTYQVRVYNVRLR
jgi:Helix-turn-helix domain